MKKLLFVALMFVAVSVFGYWSLNKGKVSWYVEAGRNTLVITEIEDNINMLSIPSSYQTRTVRIYEFTISDSTLTVYTEYLEKTEKWIREEKNKNEE